MTAILTMAALAAGFVLDAVFGDPYRLPHPVRFIGEMISGCENVIRKISPKNKWGELIGGAVLAVWILFVSMLLPSLLLIIARGIHPAVYFVVETVMCYQLIAAKQLRVESMKVYKALKEDNVSKARECVSMIVGRDTEKLDRDGIIRAAVETVAENTSDGVTAPIIYMAIFGAAGGFVYKAVNTMDSMIGYRTKKYIYFGRVAARLDDALNFIPSRITALVMVLSAGLCGLDMKSAWRIYRRDRKKHKSPNSAQCEAVCAGALNIELGGSAYYFGKRVKKPAIGDDLRPVEAEDIKKANRMMYLTSVILLLLCLSISAAVFHFII